MEWKVANKEEKKNPNVTYSLLHDYIGLVKLLTCTKIFIICVS